MRLSTSPFLHAKPMYVVPKQRQSVAHRAGILLLFVLLLPMFVLSQATIKAENALTGALPSEWDISGAGDLSIQGFSTELSVNKGSTIFFKINTTARAYTIDIYRVGYYNGRGARKWGTGTITASLPQVQPPHLYDPVTGKVDCSNWAISARWAVPSTAVPGVYLAKLTRSDTKGASHITFIVRNDQGTADILFKTSDATWQAYNNYGGTSLYGDIFGNDPPYINVPGFGHATKVSYNRPLYSSKFGRDCLKSAELPMIRWLERNGYNVSYTTCVDMARDQSLITPSKYKALFSVGHDEYWSAEERSKFEKARNAGVHLGFFSGNEVFWKTRWEDNFRTLVCYKEGVDPSGRILACGGKCDPSPVWTGLWRQGCNVTGTDGCRPENELTGTLSVEETTGTIEVPSDYKAMRFWRNTNIASLAPGTKTSLTPSTLGFEWDPDQYDVATYSEGHPNYASSYPANRVPLSLTYADGYTHKMSLYKHASGALVFGAGTIQYSWGLDGTHDRGTSVPDARLQQATVNLLADMGIQPTSLQTGLVAATAIVDNTPAKSFITLPPADNMPVVGKTYQIKGTASDAGAVGGVQVSVDGGLSWRLAEGTTNWTFNWVPSEEKEYVIKTRAFDDYGNIEAIPTNNGDNQRVFTVGAFTCPCNLFAQISAPQATQNDGKPLIIGVRFQAMKAGFITKLRFYKAPGTTGTHIGQLWTGTGTLLSEVTYTNETASGWQEVALPEPVAVNAYTTYVATNYSSSGQYVYTRPFFTQRYINDPLIALQDGEEGNNGVGDYDETRSGPRFPSGGFQASNYYVDVEFVSALPTITKNPVNATVCNGNTATFNAAANSALAVTVIWQKSTDNGANWVNIDGATSETYAFTAAQADNGTLYRAAFTNTAGTEYSKAARLTVNTVTLTTTVTNVSCQVQGSIQVTPSGGMAPYTYSINGGAYQTSNTFAGLAAGTYTVSAKDALGCVGQVAGIGISASAALNVSLVSKTNETCSKNDGTITVAASGGTSPYTYSINGGSFQTSSTFRNLSSGTYTVVARDSKGCSGTIAGIVITLESTLDAELTNLKVATCGKSDGALTITPSGGTAPYTYILNTGKSQTNGTFTGLPKGTYTVWVVDAKKCTVSVSKIELGEVSDIKVNLVYVNDETCRGSNGAFKVSVTGGNGGFRYSVNGGRSTTDTEYKNLKAGIYTVTVTDSKGCTGELDNIEVKFIPFVATIVNIKEASSTTSKDGSIQVALSGGKADYEYSVNGAKFRKYDKELITGLSAGTYTIIVRDALGCIHTLNDVVVPVATPLQLKTIVSNSCTTTNSGEIVIEPLGGSGPYTYWLIGEGIQSTGVYSDLSPGTYYAIIRDASGSYASSGAIKVGSSSSACNQSGKNGKTKTPKSAKAPATAEVVTALKVMPNPNNGSFVLNITGFGGQRVHVKVTNMLGQQVYLANTVVPASKFALPINLATGKAGLYYVTVTSDKLVLTEKIVIQ